LTTFVHPQPKNGFTFCDKFGFQRNGEALSLSNSHFSPFTPGSLKVMAEKNLSDEEIKGLKELFNNIDTDRSGTITLDELKNGLARLGSRLSEPEIEQLLEAVRTP